MNEIPRRTDRSDSALLGRRGSGVDRFRLLALLGVLALVGAVAAVLYDAVAVVGDPVPLVGIALGAVLLATALSGVVRVRTAVIAAGVAFAVGIAGWFATLPGLPSLGEMVRWNAEMLTGRSILAIVNVRIWAMAVIPGPMFATWFLALRGRYGGAALVGSAALGYLVLTGDAGATATLLGVVGVVAMLGFGDFDATDADATATEYVALTLAALILAPLLVSVVPGGAAAPVSFVDDGGEAETIERSVIGPSDRLDVEGSISLSPEVRFTVESDREAYWQTHVFDRYTGEGWVRTDGAPADAEATDRPPTATDQVSARIVAESTLEVVPAPWRPEGVGGDAEILRRSDGSLVASEPLEPGEEYVVTSERPNASRERLADAGTDYPDAIREHYLQLPEDTPDRIGELSDEIAGNASGPHETATAIESWLESQKGYSHDVDQPGGGVADDFIFEMEAGYCTHFATSMVAMLRTQEIPARMAVGYTPGERVGEDEWVVRGLNAHAWVQVYFPEVGWVDFDPTPSEPWTDERRALVESNRSDAPRDDANGTIDQGPDADLASPTPDAEPVPEHSSLIRPIRPDEPYAADGGDQGAAGRNVGGLQLPALPAGEHVLLGGAVLLGAVAAVRRAGLGSRLRRTALLRWQRPTGDPDDDVERAYRRLELLLEGRHRPRRSGETVREYLDAVDASRDARRVARLRERSRYGGPVGREDADEAMALVDDLVSER